MGSGTAKTHTLFLQVDGVTVTPGADNATTDHSSIPASTTTLKPWRMNDASRTTEIAALKTQISGILAPYGIQVVTTRPSTGTYHEMVITDDASDKVGVTQNQRAVMASGGMCNAFAAPLSYVFAPSVGTTYNQAMLDMITNMSIAMFGYEGGVPQSAKNGDCMCYTNLACTSTTTCTIGGAGTAVDSTYGCGMSGTMNEDQVWKGAFGAH